MSFKSSRHTPCAVSLIVVGTLRVPSIRKYSGIVGRVERSETRHVMIMSIMSPVNILLALRSTRPTSLTWTNHYGTRSL